MNKEKYIEIENIIQKYPFLESEFYSNAANVIGDDINDIDDFVDGYSALNDPLSLISQKYNTYYDKTKLDYNYRFVQRANSSDLHNTYHINVGNDVLRDIYDCYTERDGYDRLLLSDKNKLKFIIYNYGISNVSYDKDNMAKITKAFCDMLDEKKFVFNDTLQDDLTSDKITDEAKKYIVKSVEKITHFQMIVDKFYEQILYSYITKFTENDYKYKYLYLYDLANSNESMKSLETVCSRIVDFNNELYKVRNSNTKYGRIISAMIRNLFYGKVNNDDYNPSMTDIVQICRTISGPKEKFDDICGYLEINGANEDIEIFNQKLELEFPNFKRLFITKKYSASKSIFNVNRTEDEMAAMAAQYTKADDVNDLAAQCVYLMSQNALDVANLKTIVTKIIVENKKIKDMNFKTEKTSVINDFLIAIMFKDSLYYNGNRLGNAFLDLDSSEIKVFVKVFYDQICNPYFITTYALRDSTITGKWITSAKAFNRLAEVAFTDNKFIEDFINRYLVELEKPMEERKSTVKRFDKNFITYSSLKYILVNYMSNNSKLGLNEAETNPRVLLMKLLINDNINGYLKDFVRYCIDHNYVFDIKENNTLKSYNRACYDDCARGEAEDDVFQSYYDNFKKAFITSSDKRISLPNDINIVTYFSHTEFDRLLHFIDSDKEKYTEYDLAYNPILHRGYGDSNMLTDYSKAKIGEMSTVILALGVIAAIKCNKLSSDFSTIFTEDQKKIVCDYISNKLNGYQLEYLPTVCNKCVLNKRELQGDPFYDQTYVLNLVQYSDLLRISKLLEIKNSLGINLTITIPENAGFIPYYPKSFYKEEGRKYRYIGSELNNTIDDIVKNASSELLEIFKNSLDIYSLDNSVAYEIETKQSAVRYISQMIMSGEEINVKAFSHIRQFSDEPFYFSRQYIERDKSNLGDIYDILVKNYELILETYKNNNIFNEDKCNEITETIRNIQLTSQCLNIIE